MPLEEPGWWYGSPPGWSLAERMLAPFGDIYAAVVERRFNSARPYRSALPVICVGNFTAGGTGKTPLTRLLIDTLARREIGVVCLSRGYGGEFRGPVWVDGERHTAREVGDEPLLIARAAKKSARVMVSRDRPAGLAVIEAARSGGSRAVIMDDGLQNPSVAKDLKIAVVHARRGFGNGRVIPAGPLRARLAFQLGLVDCIVVMGEEALNDDTSTFDRLKEVFHGPVLRGCVTPAGDTDWIADKNLIAYAGIANPERFFRMLEGFGPRSVTRRVFKDHHAFTDAEAARLVCDAKKSGAELVTTEKDLARLVGRGGAAADLLARSRTLPIAVAFDERDHVRLEALVDGVLKSGARG